MKTWVKVVLAVLALGLLTCGLLVGGVAWWFDSNKDELKAQGDRMRAEAETFARTNDADACVTEAVRRLRERSSFMDEVRHKVFLSACLERAARRADFCEGVPSRQASVAAATWSLEFCNTREGVDPQACSRLSQEILEACETTAPAPDANE